MMMLTNARPKHAHRHAASVLLHHILGNRFRVRVRVRPLAEQYRRDALEQAVRCALGQHQQFAGVEGWRIEALLDALQRTVRVRGGHVHDAAQVQHLAADLQHVLARLHVDLHGDLQLLVEAHGGGHVKDDIDLCVCV